jgi:hypothetical protein
MRGGAKSEMRTLPVEPRGIGIVPVVHGLQAHDTLDPLLTHSLRTTATRAPAGSGSGKKR